jgi:SAM-dependent methyltransferase
VWQAAGVLLGEHQSFDAYAAAYDDYCQATAVPVLPWLGSVGVVLGGRALDLGCGSGRHVAEFADTFDEVVGVDISEPLIEIARARRARPNVTFVVDDLTAFADSEGFDLVFSSTALHHVLDLDAALANIRSLVRPGGWVILSDLVRVTSQLHRWLWLHGGVYVGPVADFSRHVRSHGLGLATRILRFQVSRRWIRHLLADQWLTMNEFEQRYTEAFPGGTISRRAGLPTLVWQPRNLRQ